VKEGRAASCLSAAAMRATLSAPMTKPATRPFRRMALLLLLAACGSRTGLFVDDSFGPLPEEDGEIDPRDGGADGTVAPDALPPIDARPPRDVDRTGCPDAEATLIYVITSTYELFSFDPTTNAFSPIGSISCPAAPGASPFSMAVDRRGVAYVLFRGDERLYRVSTATAACVGTPYNPGQLGFRLFGMGFATDTVGPTERLFIAGSDQENGAEGLARIDTSTFGLTKVADFAPRIVNAELTGTGDGRLFAFYTRTVTGTPRTFIGEVSTQSAQVVAETRLDTVTLGGGWAFAFWGGDFYMFTAPNFGNSQVTRYRPADASVQVVATLPAIIVGAGVSTCAPQD
jgi:hypothetical protein